MTAKRPIFVILICGSAIGLLVLCMSLLAFSFPTEAASGGQGSRSDLRPFAMSATPVSTDARNSDFFNPYDDRVDPKPGDRVIVYCERKWRDIDVWGTDEQGNGIYLTSFDYDDIVAVGSEGLTQ